MSKDRITYSYTYDAEGIRTSKVTEGKDGKKTSKYTYNLVSDLTELIYEETEEGIEAEVTFVETVEVEPTKTYNFEVEDWHTYFVSVAKIWVHNDSGICDDVVEEALHSRKGAFQAAKRDANIVESQHPFKIEKVKMTEAEYAGGHAIVDKNTGKVIETREYYFKIGMEKL
ncbi:MAG: HINT domain-containing protein [Lachnospiraceae bacterium]|nr:HINT domain-containing protein [Lachnospiraceae bacterium]